MGLLKKAMETYNKDYAYNLYTSYTEKPKSVLKKYNSKNDFLYKVIELTGEPSSSRDYFIVSNCLLDLGIDHIHSALKTIYLYACLGSYLEGSPDDVFDTANYEKHRKNMINGAEWEKIGKEHEKNYDFNSALICYLKAFLLTPYIETPIFYIADLYTKMNNIDDGIVFLSNIKKSKYKNMKQAASEKMKELKDKKDRGYVYRPRPRK